MLVNNYYQVRKIMNVLTLSGSTSQEDIKNIVYNLGNLTNPNGEPLISLEQCMRDAYSIYSSTDNTLFSTTFRMGCLNRAVSGIAGHGISNTGSNTNTSLIIAVGNGTKEVNINDYNLNSPYVYGTDYSKVDGSDKAIIESSNSADYTISTCIKALTKLNITEVGLCSAVKWRYNSATPYKRILLSRELLDEPLILEPNQMATIDITIHEEFQ